MPDVNKENINSEAVPFFARYLEGQFIEDLSEEEMEAVAGGFGGNLTVSGSVDQNTVSSNVSYTFTAKFPSDNDEQGYSNFP